MAGWGGRDEGGQGQAVRQRLGAAGHLSHLRVVRQVDLSRDVVDGTDPLQERVKTWLNPKNPTAQDSDFPTRKGVEQTKSYPPLHFLSCSPPGG